MTKVNTIDGIADAVTPNLIELIAKGQDSDCLMGLFIVGAAICALTAERPFANLRSPFVFRTASLRN